MLFAPISSHSVSFWLRRGTVLSILALSTLLSGCLSMKSYVDPALPKVAYSELVPTAEKHSVQLLFEFQTNGKLNAAATNQLRPQVVSTLQKSALFTDVVVPPAQADYKIFITINNVAEIKDATGKGVKVGLTFGLAGDMVTDGYQCKATYQAPGQAPIVKNYVHAIHSTIGNTKGPEGLTPMSMIDAANKMTEEVVLNVLRDLNKEGAL